MIFFKANVFCSKLCLYYGDFATFVVAHFLFYFACCNMKHFYGFFSYMYLTQRLSRYTIDGI